MTHIEIRFLVTLGLAGIAGARRMYNVHVAGIITVIVNLTMIMIIINVIVTMAMTVTTFIIMLKRRRRVVDDDDEGAVHKFRF